MYSVYKNDCEIAFGTIEEIAKQLNVKVETVFFYGTPSWRKRSSENAKRLVKAEEE